MRLAVSALVVMAFATLPSLASADSGSITNVAAADGGQVQATYTSTSTTCRSDGFCGWYPHAKQVPADQACGAFSTDHLTYVGNFQDDVGTQTGTDTFRPLGSSVRICLYISGPDDSEHFVAEYIYNSATPSQPQPPPPDTNQVPPLTIRDAKATLPHLLRHEYGRRFTRRRHFRRSCYRYTTQKVRCDVRWEYRNYGYRGHVTMRNDRADPATSVLYSLKIRRKRLHPRPAPGPQRNCDPNYSGCLNPNASDYDCAGGSGDGPYYTGPVRVLGDDHFDLDRDGDGVACDES
jgi:hypothetical protein